MRLSRNSLPPEASSSDYDTAVAAFSSSVTRETQAGYATAVRHFLAAEVKLGRKFHMPPSEEEQNFLLNYLQQQGLKKPTISSYLSALSALKKNETLEF